MSATCCTNLYKESYIALFDICPFTADDQERHNDLEVFSVSPTNGILEAREGDPPTKEILQISFTARYSSQG